VKMRLVREQMLVEDDRSARGLVLRATAENMVKGATKHTAAQTQRRRSKLVALHGLLRWRHKRMSEGRDIIRMPRGNRKSSKGKTSIISERNRGADRGGDREVSSQGRKKVSQFPVNGQCEQPTSRGSSEWSNDEQQRVRVDGERQVA
jgi:hypothetical protein